MQYRRRNIEHLAGRRGCVRPGADPRRRVRRKGVEPTSSGESRRGTSAGQDDASGADQPARLGARGVFLPSEDTPGRDVPDLPRYPDSVRVEYERKELDALILTRARYLSTEKVDIVRGFYRGVFRSEDWKVANVEFSDDEWTFLVVKGEREAEIEVRPHNAGSETDVRLSAPRPPEQPDKKAASEASPPDREAAPEPSPTPATASPASTATASAPPSYASPPPASASPAPATVPPAPAPDDYEFEEDDSDDFEGEDD